MKIFAALVLLVFAVAGVAQTPKKSITWKIDNLKKIGGVKVEVLGNPQIIKTPLG